MPAVPVWISEADAVAAVDDCAAAEYDSASAARCDSRIPAVPAPAACSSCRRERSAHIGVSFRASLLWGRMRWGNSEISHKINRIQICIQGGRHYIRVSPTTPIGVIGFFGSSHRCFSDRVAMRPESMREYFRGRQSLSGALSEQLPGLIHSGAPSGRRRSWRAARGCSTRPAPPLSAKT
jgi:hypothetical protein